MTVSDATLRAIAANAVRHLLEADQHYKAGRFPSATASAVLSIEEAGKLSHAAAQGSLPKEKRHAAHAILFVGVLKVCASWGWSAEWAKFIRGEFDPAALGLSAQQQQDIANHPELAEFVRRLQAGELVEQPERLQAWAAAVVAKEQRDGTMKQWEPLISKGLQAIRLRATYVDIGPSGEVQSGPSSIDEGNAKFMCTGAVGFLILTLLLAAYTRKSLELGDVVANVPDDVTGLDTLRKAFPVLSAKVEAYAAIKAATTATQSNT